MRSPISAPRQVSPPAATPPAMRSPSTGSPMQLVDGEPAAYSLRGLSFTVSGPAWECPDTGQRYNSPDQVDAVLARVHELWREHRGISRAALQSRRETLALSAAQASVLLGFGTNQYRTYEQTDKLPSKSNAVLLYLLMTDQGIRALLEASGQALKPAARRRLEQYLAAAAPAPGVIRRPIQVTSTQALATTAGQLPAPAPPLRQPIISKKAQRQLAAVAQAYIEQHAAALAGPQAQAGDYSYAMAA